MNDEHIQKMTAVVLNQEARIDELEEIIHWGIHHFSHLTKDSKLFENKSIDPAQLDIHFSDAIEHLQKAFPETETITGEHFAIAWRKFFCVGGILNGNWIKAYPSSKEYSQYVGAGKTETYIKKQVEWPEEMPGRSMPVFVLEEMVENDKWLEDLPTAVIKMLWMKDKDGEPVACECKEDESTS